MNIRGILLGTAIAALIPGAAMAAGEGFYVGAAGGANWTRDAEYRQRATGGEVEFEYENGWAVSGSAGYKFSFGLRTELEVNYRWSNDIDGDDDAAARWSGRTNSLGFMGNVIYDIPTGTAFTPYIGVGAGMARVRTQASNNLGFTFSDRDWVFAYQGIAGVAYNITNNLAITADYRYFATAEPDFTSPAGTLRGEYHNHTVMAGLRYSFGAPAAPAAAVTALAQPAQVAPQNEYLVFFDWDKANITQGSDRIIGDAAAAAGRARAVSIQVIGHTDSSGAPAYNQRLSMRRAEAVKRSLISKGVPANQISVEAKGESQLMVPTGANVREPSNRRAQIVIRVQ